MKYTNKRMPIREVWFGDFNIIGNDVVRANMNYTTESEKQTTWVTQPVEFSLCEMRHFVVKSHNTLNILEDRLREAREEMKGTR